MKIRAAILGYGRNGSTMHAGAIVHHPGLFEMAAICDIDPERRKEARERFDCPVYEDYHAMLQHERLDLVCIVTRSDQHCAMTCDCLAAGMHVLVTKPWAVNEGEARQMMDVAARAQGKLLPWLPSRWGCQLARLKELLALKAIGDVFMVRRSVCAFATRNDWQMQRQHGGGYLLNWGAHIIDPPVLLLGSPVKSAYGRLKQTINPGDAEDLFCALLTLENGALVQAEYTVATEALPCWFLQGTEGTIVVRDKTIRIAHKIPARPDDPTDAAAMQDREATITEEEVEGATYGDEKAIYAEIAAALRGESAYPVMPQDALELTRVFDAIRLSDAENRVVTL